MSSENISTEQIDGILSSSEFPDATTGGCVSFAVALDRVFGVESYPCAFDPFDDSKPLHCMAVIDDVVFDAEGSHGTDPTYVQNWWSGLKPKDFNAVVDEAEETGRDRWDVMNEHLQECAYENIPSEYGVENLGAVQRNVERYEKLIEKKL